MSAHCLSHLLLLLVERNQHEWKSRLVYGTFSLRRAARSADSWVSSSVLVERLMSAIMY